MEVKREKCKWCERTYAVMDSTASDRDLYCSQECEAEYDKACSECDKWYDEIREAWDKLREEYEPGEDEGNPCYDSDTPCGRRPRNKRVYLAFKTRYQKWKNNHCWKESFWAWDESSGGSFFGGGSGGDDSSGCGDGLVMLVLKGIGILVAVWIGWAVIKGVWNGIFGGGKDEFITEASIMEKWEEHLEKRREAFDDGKSEKEIEARGLRNYTWEEWQEKFKKEHEAADKPQEGKKEVKGGEDDSDVKKAKDIGGQAISAAKGLGDKAKELWQNVTSKDEKDPEAELKRLNARIAELEQERRADAEKNSGLPKDEELKPPVPAAREISAAVASATTGGTMDVEIAKNDAAEADDGAKRNKASKDSSAIRIAVQGKGKTQDAAIRWALREAVWRTVGTWVDSKTRIQENRDKVVAQVKKITEADVPKFEVIDAQKLDGDYIVKVRVSVSKKKIAPKFADIFPDVFGNVND